ncbi:MAG TPA: hypothetical protein PLD27_09550 [bacterium]|nr:hypothetical protein [bacterium]HOL48294.1 hypothetical protein [bacterium]HPQ19379.1 hypothetical protein [bacterium]
MFLIDLILIIFIFSLSIEFFLEKNQRIKKNKYYKYLENLNSYILQFFKDKKKGIIISISSLFILRILILYFYNNLYTSEIFGWYVRYYYLDANNKRIPDLSIFNSITISIIFLLTILYRLIIVISIMYFAKIKLIKLSDFFELIFELIEPLYDKIRASAYGGIKYPTNLITIFLATFYYYVLWCFLSFNFDFHTIINGIIVVLSININLLFIYSLFLLMVVLLFGLNKIKNRKIKMLCLIFYGPVKFKIEKYYIFKNYRFNIGLLSSALILFFSTIIINHILNDVLFTQFNF